MKLKLQKLFETQAAWQRTRAKLSWPEKIRMAEVMRESALRLRASSSPGRKREETTPEGARSPGAQTKSKL
jgi:hypothetical protein